MLSDIGIKLEDIVGRSLRFCVWGSIRRRVVTLFRQLEHFG
jgi:hypothetical protein